MVINTFKAIYPNVNFITESESYFEGVKNEYVELKENGFFNSKSFESLYICQIVNETRTFTGLIAAVSIQDYLDGHIKGHEATLSAKEQVHVNIVLKNKAFLKPVLLTYPIVAEIHKILADYTSNNESFLKIENDIHRQVHTFWQIKDLELVNTLIDLFNKKVPVTYIADGHHRTSTTALLYNRLQGKIEQEDFSTLLAGFFPSNELEIDEFNRVVEALDEMSSITFMAKLSAVCEITPLEAGRKPLKKNEMTMLIKKEWFSLVWRQKVIEKHAADGLILDAALLNTEVIQNIIGISDIKNDPRVKYVEGPAGISAVKNLVAKDDDNIGFCLYPLLLDELMQVSDKGDILPPKSTYFQPRLRNGLIIMDH